MNCHGLTADDITDTMNAFVENAGNVHATARSLRLHENSAKHRLKVVRRRWGCPEASAMELLARAVRAGYGYAGLTVDNDVRGFVLFAMPKPTEGDYFGLAIRLWLADKLEQWTALRVSATSEAAA